MATFKPDSRGSIDDRVRLVAGGREIMVAQSYEFASSIMTQPAAFSLRTGHGDVARELLEQFKPGTDVELWIGERRQCVGRIDDQEGGGYEATVVGLKGRDLLATLHDADITADRSFRDATLAQIVEAALKDVGLGHVTVVSSNEANRNKRVGVRIRQKAKEPEQPPAQRTVAEIIAGAGEASQAAAAGPIHYVAQARAGETWYAFLKRYLDRAGLFLWAAEDGALVLAEPTVEQSPFARLVRRRGAVWNEVNVLRASFRNGTSTRISKAIVYGRGGGFKFGRSKSRVEIEDAEMVAYGIHRPRVIRDENVRTQAQAEHAARRALAESARAGWQLRYTVAGHTTPAIGGGRAVWAPDTIVEVDDDELGLEGLFYLESCVYRRAPETTTELVLMRPEHLIFGEAA